jgi:hypothetical protein
MEVGVRRRSETEHSRPHKRPSSCFSFRAARGIQYGEPPSTAPRFSASSVSKAAGVPPKKLSSARCVTLMWIVKPHAEAGRARRGTSRRRSAAAAAAVADAAVGGVGRRILLELRTAPRPAVEPSGVVGSARALAVQRPRDASSLVRARK